MDCCRTLGLDTCAAEDGPDARWSLSIASMREPESKRRVCSTVRMEERQVAAAKLIKLSTPRVVVAIPVHNEAEHIEACLNALAHQVPTFDFDVVALLNNCTDETSSIVGEAASRMPFRLHIFEYWLHHLESSAGAAR